MGKKKEEEVVEILPAEMVKDLTTQKLDADVDQDYDYTRENLKDIIGKGTTALDGILELAQESEHPRAYEVVGQIIKTVVDANIQLVELQKNIKALKKKDETRPNNIKNALFVGSTHELQKLLKDVKADERKD